ncbi:class A beta-lactamase [Methylobacterium organophilum]|uniref:Beta-lactamase n=1 Tax=Methylobacterium organophilum TaxID=410 RepID=A0ABQ4TAM0_METOR|nr:class A beta-lactamase [Methylobacterium organophilum]GJE28722.1 Beta-lactamase CTX-M-97 [Methylobacterium organophilum]
MIGRRHLLAGGLAGSLSALPPLRAIAAAGEAPEGFAAIEAASGGRLGAFVLDTGDGSRLGWRASERFPLCSTFKPLAAAAVLKAVEAGRDSLDRRVAYGPEALVPYSPVTGTHVGEGMTLADLCAAAITLSDNTAGNLLLAAIGGPAGLTAFLRGIGDATTRLDRTEPDLNEALSGDPRDTTTPEAMAETLRALLLGDALASGSRARLIGWLEACRTGAARLRAGVPEDWRVGDKTGTGERGSANDVGLLQPPGKAPLVVAVFLTGSSLGLEPRDAAIAAVARMVAARRPEPPR